MEEHIDVLCQQLHDYQQKGVETSENKTEDEYEIYNKDREEYERRVVEMEKQLEELQRGYEDSPSPAKGMEDTPIKDDTEFLRRRVVQL